MSAEHPTVIVIDAEELFRNGIIETLEERGIRVVGRAGLAADGIRQACQVQPDVVLMDLDMPGMSGIEATHRLAAAAPHVRVVVLTVASDDRHVLDALLAGACGYLLKDSSTSQIVDAVRAAARGESMISPRVATRLVRRLRDPSNPELRIADPNLTPREHEVLELMARGIDNPEIAHALYLSEHTVKNHVSSILAKLEVENRIQAAVLAVRRSLL